MGRTLRAMGIGRRDRVAVVLPNGPEMAVAILTVAASATCAPLNPAYGAEELDRYFADLRPRALITQAGIDSPARRVALSRGIRVIELSTAFDAEAGLFTLTGDHRRRAVRRAGQPQRRGAAAAHVRHNVATKDCPADARQHLYVGLRARCSTGAERNRSMLECAAPVSWAWSRCHGDGLAGGGCECRMYPRVVTSTASLRG